jgi:hypothetical protein
VDYFVIILETSWWHHLWWFEIHFGGCYGVFLCALTLKIIVSKLIIFETNDVKDIKTNVIVQLKNQNAPFMIDVHCMNYHINLMVQTFSKLSIVGKIVSMLQNLYAYFSIFKREPMNILNGPILWKEGVNGFWETSKFAEFQCFSQLRIAFEHCALLLKMCTKMLTYCTSYPY